MAGGKDEGVAGVEALKVKVLSHYLAGQDMLRLQWLEIVSAAQACGSYHDVEVINEPCRKRDIWFDE